MNTGIGIIVAFIFITIFAIILLIAINGLSIPYYN